MPIHRISLAAFKCYDARTELELGAITLLLGRNSAGKSTVIQALLALCQSLRGPLPLPEVLVCSGPLVDIGRFGNALNSKAHDRVLTLGVATSPSDSVDLDFDEGELSAVHLGTTGDAPWRFRVRRPAPGKLALSPAPDRFATLPLQGEDAARVVGLLIGERAQVTAEVHLGRDGWDVAFTEDPEQPLDEAARRLLTSQSSRSEGYRDTVRSTLEGLVNKRVAVLSLVRDRVFPIGPARVYGLRVERVDDVSEDRWVGLAGERLLQVLHDHPEAVDRVNRWLAMLDVPYRLLVERAGQAVETIEPLLESGREPPHRVGLPDVGFGIGQVLPLLVQMAVVQEGLVTVEQPEIHLHPRMQALLAWVIADWVAPAEGEPWGQRQILVETHSEHMVLGLQALLRGQSPLPSGQIHLVALRPSRVHGRSGPELTRIRLDLDGAMLDPWPDGFFPERERLIRRGRVDA